MPRHALQRISDRIYYLPSDPSLDRPILAGIVGSERTLMVDAGASRAHARLFLDQFEDATGRAPDWVALTHWHWDHTFGLAHVQARAVGQRHLADNLRRLQGLSWDDEALAARVRNGQEIAFCAEMIAREYGDDRDIRIVLPGVLFDERLTIDLGEVRCELRRLTTDHSDDSVAVWVPEERTLFLGDALGAQYYAPAPYYSAQNALALVDQVRSYPASWLIESHGEPVGVDAFWSENGIIEATARCIADGARDRDALLSAVVARIGQPVPADDMDVIEGFLRGLLVTG